MSVFTGVCNFNVHLYIDKFPKDRKELFVDAYLFETRSSLRFIGLHMSYIA